MRTEKKAMYVEKTNADECCSDVSESSGTTSHLGHSIRLCHRTPLPVKDTGEIFHCECTARTLPFLSWLFGLFYSGGLKRRCSNVPDSQFEIKGKIASEQCSVIQKVDSAIVVCKMFLCISSFENVAVQMFLWTPIFISSKELTNQIPNCNEI